MLLFEMHSSHKDFLCKFENWHDGKYILHLEKGLQEKDKKVGFFRFVFVCLK